ncbi:MAG TPA: CoA transferase, partial [Nevskiaceae bacterium]|nr:CoA transferase [Nevskiaceae bacterium]
MQTIARLKVLELCGCVSSAFCTRLFAGFGADVLVLPSTRPGTPAFTPEEHAWFHSGKRVATFDGTSKQIEALLDDADVVVDSW